MRTPLAPRLDERRAPEFTAELLERARAWIPEWGMEDSDKDFGLALLEIAARFNSEVAERLDGAGEKMRRGFLDWLAERGEAARPARTPVVFKLADTAREPVLAEAPVRMQVDASGTPVVFETERDVRLIPGQLSVVVGVDADKDAFYLPPPGLSDLKPIEPLPTEWQLKSFAATGAKKLQLDPDTGLAPEMIIDAGGRQYRIVGVENEIVTVDPPLDAELPEGTTVRKVVSFAPFAETTRNRQEHALYLGHMDLLNIEGPATIEVVGATALITGITWQYWGKTENSDEPDWQTMAPIDQLKPDAVALRKPKGAVEPRAIDGVNSRWIRAFTTKVEGTTPLLQVDALELRINDEPRPPCPAGTALIKASTEAEAMANTTPLVLDNIFFPLGKEPRQFDAFYLGSQEAFSKIGARVQLCFEMADRTFSSLAAIREGTFENSVLAGVAKDRSLHLLSFNPSTGSIGKFRDRDPLQPPRPGYLGATAEGNTVALDAERPWRLPTWSELDFPFFAGFLVAASAVDTIWIWREHSLVATASGWIDFGKLPSSGPPTSAAVDGLVYLAGAPPFLAALRAGELFTREWPGGPEWDQVDTKAAGTAIALKSIVPVLVKDLSGRLVTSAVAGMVGIDDQKKLFRVDTSGVCTPLLAAFDFNPAILPVAIEIGGVLNVAAVTDSDPPELVAVSGAGMPEQKPLGADKEVLAALEAMLIGAEFHVIATVRDGAGGNLTTWAPFEAGAASSIFESPVAPTGAIVEGAPLAVGGYVVIPAARADILVSEFDPSLRLFEDANVEIGVVVPDSIPALAVNDLIVRSDVNGEPVSREITQAGITKDGEVFYRIGSAFPAQTTGLRAYDLSPTLGGTFNDPDLTLDPADQVTADGDWLWIDGEFYEVLSITINNNDRIATLDVPNSNGVTPPSGDYARPIRTNGRIAPFMDLNPSPGQNGDWDASLLERIRLIFPTETPSEQRAKAFTVNVQNKPVIVVLGEEFQSVLANPTDFLVDAAFGEWRRDAGDTSTNPELSWEYWNGKGWWKLNVTLDDTQHLKTTGAVRFDVPSDIASSDWAGKTNHWIRARLVGGDYGREKVIVRTKNLGGGDTEQTVDRSSEGIRAPSVVKLHVSYQVSTGMRPTYVRAQDSGTIRDQSDANRTASAIVEAFVPLAVMLGRLLHGAASTELTNDCPPECDCPGQHVGVTGAETDPETQPLTDAPIATGRSIFIGLDATPTEAPINVLVRAANEARHTPFAPMTVEALAADRFVPIVSDDATRALGESGLISMTFAVPPTRSELFGNENLTWLRLSPKPGPSDEWEPTFAGVYLNAAWASATETLTRELLGSSAGEPNLTLTVARPPVLLDTLELRVREPLGEEERDALRLADPLSVLSAVEGLPGDWVLWKQVIDPDDEPADARVYSLDEANGVIRFGDGLHGKIPPIGRDSIVAFSYQRTEPPIAGSDIVPGNTIATRTTLNLVSPVETVESVIAADQAAGGAPPESDERVLRFGFARARHRERAVTADDIEDLALQSSPDIVQARATVRRGDIQLVVVMKGNEPAPNGAQVRELRRLLLGVAPASLAADSLRIKGPEIRKLRVELKLRIETLDQAGALGKWVKENLARFFDTSTGGIDGDGWVLGVNPSEQDIALALMNAPELEGIGDIKLTEIVDDGTARPWPEMLKSTEIVMLADDPVRIEFETAEVLV